MKNYEEILSDTFDQITQIGEGGGGTIFRAYHKRLEKDVVLKKIHTDQLKSIDRKGERNILKNLKHNYIPQILDFIEYGDEVFTVMEYIPGQSFAQLLKRGEKFFQKDVSKWMLQLCEVVVYLHSQKPPIIHCDIKPDNIMLTPEGNICLIDFNISGVKTEEGIASIGYSHGYAPVEQFAVVAGRLERLWAERGQDIPAGKSDSDQTELLSGQASDQTEILSARPNEDHTELVFSENDSGRMPAAGSPSTGITKSLIQSMSDEEWEAAKRVEASAGKSLIIDERTDIYSMGAAFYHILIGKKPRPFYREQISMQQIDENISGSLAYVIGKAMAVRPSERFQSASQMLNTIRNMGTVDKRYKALSRRQLLTAILMGVLTIASAVTISIGKSVMIRERRDQYQSYIEEMHAARAEKDYNTVTVDYEKAIQLYEDDQDAYYEMSMAYYDQKQYEQCIDFLSQNVYTNSVIQLDIYYGRFYYITASCYFELEDYNSASSYYGRAIELQPGEISYYRDYVVSLARNGEVDKAERMLQKAVNNGISADVISLLQGEIALLRNEPEECEKYLTDCIESTKDDYIRLRAFTKLDDAYQIMYEDTEQYDVRIELLEKALAGLPEDYQITLMERLAQVYINYSDIENRDDCCERAIALFEQMEERGYATFTSRYNIAVLYEKTGRFGEAQEQLEAMLGIYPDNYVIYKRLAFVELDAQAAKEKSDRDYHDFHGFYEEAFALYQENAAREDMEMLSLQQLYNDVVANGWL